MTGERTTQEQRSGDGMTAKEDIRHIFLEQMEQLAYSYTPEWKFDAEHPDVGSVLLSIYSDLLSKMMQCYQQVPERAKAEFMSVLGTRTKPAEAAKGYLSIESMQGVTDTYVLPSGMGLIAKQETQEDVKWMTQKELCVSAAEMKTIYYTDGIRDAIYCVAQKQGPLTPSLRQNLQEHVCCLGHSVILAVTGEAEIWIRFFPENQWKDWDQLIRDREKTMFTYLSREGEIRFREWTCDHHIIRLKKTKEMPDFQTESHNDKTGGWLCWISSPIRILRLWIYGWVLYRNEKNRSICTVRREKNVLAADIRLVRDRMYTVKAIWYRMQCWEREGQTYIYGYKWHFAGLLY